MGSQAHKVSTGRGGAGNMRDLDRRVSPHLIPQGSHTPSILQPVYSTGRGGAGNMRKNYDPKITRLAQDVDEDDEILLNGSAPGFDEDYIGPIHPEEEEPLEAVENSPNRITSHHSKLRSHHSRSSARNKLQSKRSGASGGPLGNSSDRVMIGRGGAGNFVSPITSDEKSEKLKHKGVKAKNSKHGFWSTLKGIFY